MGPDGSSLLSQQCSNCTYPVPHQSVPRPPSYFLKIHCDNAPLLSLGLPSGLFTSGFPTKTMCTPFPNSIRDTRKRRKEIELENSTKIPILQIFLLKSTPENTRKKSRPKKGTKKISRMRRQRKNKYIG